MQAARALMKNEKGTSGTRTVKDCIARSACTLAAGKDCPWRFQKKKEAGDFCFPPRIKPRWLKTKCDVIPVCSPGQCWAGGWNPCCHCDWNKRLYSLLPVLPWEFTSNAPFNQQFVFGFW